jgi:hypothetical protein
MTVPTGPRGQMLVRWSERVQQTIALTTRLHRVVAQRDPGLSVEALTLLGDAFEALALRTARIFRLPPIGRAVEMLPRYSGGVCGHGQIAQSEIEEVYAIMSELRDTTIPRPDLLRRLQLLRAHFRRLDEARRREYGLLQPEDALAVMAEWLATLQLARLFYISAFDLSARSEAVTPRPWRVLKHLRADDEEGVEDLVRLHLLPRMPHPPEVNGWLALPQPGAILPEPTVLHFGLLAPSNP